MSDRQEDVVSETGVWVDTETGQVVESEPESGQLIVPPGGIVDQRVLDDIAAAKAAAGPAVDVEEDDENDTEPGGEVDERPRRGRPPGSKNKPKEAVVPDDTDKAVE